MSDDNTTVEGWAIVDLLGHLRMGGYVSEIDFGGTRVGRIDVPADGDEPPSAHLFGGQSVYRLSFVDEKIARRVARAHPPRPIDHYTISADIRARLEGEERERIRALHERRGECAECGQDLPAPDGEDGHEGASRSAARTYAGGGYDDDDLEDLPI